MPLSEHEQRMLDQIESALYAEDPKFASNVRGGRLRGAAGKRRVLAAIGFAVGLMLLIAGMLLGKVEYTVIVGIAGFLLMFGSVVYLFLAGSGRRGPAAPSGMTVPSAHRRAARPRGSAPPARPSSLAWRNVSAAASRDALTLLATESR